MGLQQEVRKALGAVWRIALDTAVLAAAPQAVRADAVCIVRLDAIGDFVLWIDAGRQLAAHYRARGWRVVLLANSAWGHWARGLVMADEVWEIDPARFACDTQYRAGWLRRIHAAGFAMAIQPTHSRSAILGDALIRAAGSDKRIGSAGDSENSPQWLKRWSDAWHTDLIPCGPPAKMELLRNADFMRGLGFTDFQARVPFLDVRAKSQAAVPPEAYVVLAPGAGWAGRAWPVESFAETGRRLLALGLRLVLVGGVADRTAADDLMRQLQGTAEDLVGKTSLAELAVVLAGARLVVSNETATAHIGAAVGTRVVCVVGGGHFGRFMPYQTVASDDRRIMPVAVVRRMDCFGCNWNCIYARPQGGPVKCVKNVTTDEVWQQVATCLTADDARV